MPRKRKTDKKLKDAIPNRKEIKSNKKYASEEPAVGSQLREGFDKLQANDLNLTKKVSYETKTKGQKKLTRKTKNRQHSIQRASVHLTTSQTRRPSERTTRSSDFFGFSENLESHTILRLRSIKQSVVSEGSLLPPKEDVDVSEEVSAESEYGSEFFAEFDTDNEGDIDDIEELRESIRKSSTYQDKERASKQSRGTNFFDVLGDMPDIDILSLDLSIFSEAASMFQLEPSISKQIDLDTGKFVDPLTGVEITSSSSTPISLLAVTGPPEMSLYSLQPAESAVDLMEEITFDEDEDLGQAFEADEEKKEEEGGDMGGINFGNWLQGRPSRMTTIGLTQAAYDEFMNQMRVYVYDFVDQLITRVVNAVEYGEPGRVISQKLDKLKIMAELDDSLKKLEFERKHNMMLNKGATEYLHRRGDNRGLKEDRPEDIKQLIDKHAKVQAKLWEVLEQEEQLKNYGAKRLLDARAELEGIERISNQSVNDMEKLIKNTLYKERFQYMNQVINV